MALLKRKSIKKVYIAEKKYLIKKLLPDDFIEEIGIPFSVFQLQIHAGTASEIMKDIKSEAQIQRDFDQKLEMMALTLRKAVVWPIKFDPWSLLTKDKLDYGLALFSQILTFSLKSLKKIYTLKREYIVFIDIICKRYGQSPFSMVFPMGNNRFSEIEIYIFNMFVATTGIEAENKRIRELNRKMKQKSKFRNR